LGRAGTDVTAEPPDGPCAPKGATMTEADPRRLLLMLRELHRLGYERLRAVTGMSPSGCYWRVAITPAANTRPAPSGERLVDYDRDVA